MRVLKEVRQHLKNYHLKSAVFHFHRGEHGPAAEYLTRLLAEEELSSFDRRTAIYYLVQTRIGAASEHEAREELDRAMEQYELALQVIPDYPDVHFRLGQVLTRLGRHEDAVEQFRRAIATNPGYLDAQLRLGYALLTLGRDAEAQAAFRAALASIETGARERIAGAERALREGSGEAREMYLDTIREEMDRFRAHMGAGLEFLRDEKWEEASRELEAAATLCPRFADVHNYLGIALAEAGELERACEAFRRSVRLNPDYLVAALNLAFTAHAHGEVEEAKAAVQKILEREPDNTPALHLAEVLSRKKTRRAPAQGAAG
ncbi:MAG: tetratricopeptide repeat protein [Acidobacteria bacterium]|nr:tetratricopeptide repeat protein [Acidobacteriota bacterium]